MILHLAILSLLGLFFCVLLGPVARHVYCVLSCRRRNQDLHEHSSESITPRRQDRVTEALRP